MVIGYALSAVNLSVHFTNYGPDTRSRRHGAQGRVAAGRVFADRSPDAPAGVSADGATRGAGVGEVGSRGSGHRTVQATERGRSVKYRIRVAEAGGERQDGRGMAGGYMASRRLAYQREAVPLAGTGAA